VSEFIRKTGMPKDYNVYAFGDVHKGAKACHDEAFSEMIGRIGKDPLGFWLCLGDLVEGQPQGHQHFDVHNLDRRTLTIEEQFEAVAEDLRPISEKCLYVGLGNHDLRLAKDGDFVKHIVCKPLGLPQGGYQTVWDGGDVRIHSWHGRSVMPRGAKDPIQREANQRAWMVNRLAPLFGNAHVMLMGHVHHLLVQPPLEKLALMARGNSIRARHFVEPAQTVKTKDPATGKVDSREYIPPLSRFYAITGTFRRSGGPGYTDYAEVAGYPPSLIGFQLIKVRGGVVRSIEPQII